MLTDKIREGLNALKATIDALLDEQEVEVYNVLFEQWYKLEPEVLCAMLQGLLKHRIVGPALEWNPAWGDIWPYAAMDMDGTWVLCGTEPVQACGCWETPGGGQYTILVSHKPTYTGDWKKSLIKNPNFCGE